MESSTKSLLDQLPKETVSDNLVLYKWEGFWFPQCQIEGAVAVRSQFEARHDDVILASTVRTGTTWLKALCMCIMQRQCSDDGVENDDDDDEDLLVKNPPAVYVQTLEAHLSGMPSPRLFHTYMPYTCLPNSIKNSKCKIVYITRNPKDTLVSLWYFLNTLRKPGQGPHPLEKAFEDFCNGVVPSGPFFDHVLEYWKESLNMPHKILFLKYEELKRDPKGQVKRLASFLGKPFVKEEEVDKVLGRCSMERLKNLEVNKNGVDPWGGMPNSSFFRLGVVGDWKNNFTPEMGVRLDQITRMKLEGSGLELEI